MFKPRSDQETFVANMCYRQCWRQKLELFLKFFTDNCIGDIVIDKFLFSIRGGKNSIKFINIVTDNELTRPDRSNSIDKHLVNVSYFIYLFGFRSVLPRPSIHSSYFNFILLLFLLVAWNHSIIDNLSFTEIACL